MSRTKRFEILSLPPIPDEVDTISLEFIPGASYDREAGKTRTETWQVAFVPESKGSNKGTLYRVLINTSFHYGG